MKKKVILIIKNLCLFLISLFLIISLTFFMLELIPGEIYDLDYIKDENVIVNIRTKYNLDKPILIRYITTLSNLIKLDFGNSFINNGLSVNSVIFKYFPTSAKIGLVALLLSIIFGLLIGYKMFQLRNKRQSKNIRFLIIFLSSIPTFIFAIILQYFLCVKLKIFPVYGLERISAYVLPILILSISPTIFISRTFEKKLYDLIDSDCLTFANARGMKRKNIIMYYYIYNSVAPILSFLGPTIANLLVGSFVVESIFNIPGLGRYFITAINNRDYPMVLGLTTFFSILLIGSTYFFSTLATMLNYKGDVLNENR